MGAGDVRLYAASLTAQNRDVARRSVTGTATFVFRGDHLDVTLQARGLSDGRHIAMLQGFADGRDATCPTRKADRNSDGVIDAAETAALAGTPLIPMNFAMSTLEYESDDYPVAHDGQLLFEHATSRSDLLASLSAEHAVHELEMENYCVVLYGVPELTKLPRSVQTLPDTPASHSVPVACGVVTRVR